MFLFKFLFKKEGKLVSVKKKPLKKSRIFTKNPAPTEPQLLIKQRKAP